MKPADTLPVRSTPTGVVRALIMLISYIGGLSKLVRGYRTGPLEAAYDHEGA
jgi:hypothetical protein